MVECSKCGSPVDPEANFCSHCGERLAPQGTPTGDSTRMIPVVTDPTTTLELGPDDLAAVQALAQDRALLIVERGPDAGARFLLDGDAVTAGRHPGSDIFLDDITVSRHHARFTRREGQVWVSDENSLNGTYVNKSLIDAPTALRRGDEVQIGKFRMLFFTHPG